MGKKGNNNIHEVAGFLGGRTRMNFVCSIRNDILIVELNGELIKNEFCDAAIEVGRIVDCWFDALHDSGKKKMLVDARELDGHLLITRDHLLARKLPPLDPNVSVAVVEQREYKGHTYFSELAVRKPSRIYLRCFIDRDKALTWLNEQG
jgi:hypothetical protein